jgi:hypothetical protein
VDSDVATEVELGVVATDVLLGVLATEVVVCTELALDSVELCVLVTTCVVDVT